MSTQLARHVRRPTPAKGIFKDSLDCLVVCFSSTAASGSSLLPFGGGSLVFFGLFFGWSFFLVQFLCHLLGSGVKRLSPGGSHRDTLVIRLPLTDHENDNGWCLFLSSSSSPSLLALSVVPSWKFKMLAASSPALIDPWDLKTLKTVRWTKQEDGSFPRDSEGHPSSPGPAAESLNSSALSFHGGRRVVFPFLPPSHPG